MKEFCRGGSRQKNPGRIRDGYPSQIRPGNLSWAGTGTDIYVRRIGRYVAYPLLTKYYIKISTYIRGFMY